MVVEDLELNISVNDNGATRDISNIKSQLRDLDRADETTVDVRVNRVGDLDLDDLDTTAVVQDVRLTDDKRFGLENPEIDVDAIIDDIRSKGKNFVEVTAIANKVRIENNPEIKGVSPKVGARVHDLEIPDYLIETVYPSATARVDNVDLSAVEPVEIDAALDIKGALRKGFETSSKFKRANGSGTGFVRRGDDAGIRPASVDDAVGKIKEVVGAQTIDATLDIKGALREEFETSSKFKQANGSGTEFVRRSDDAGIRPASADDAIGEIEEVVGAQTIDVTADVVDVNATVGTSRSTVSAGGQTPAVTSGGEVLPAQVDLGNASGVDIDEFSRRRRLLSAQQSVASERSVTDPLKNLNIQFNDLYEVLIRLVPFLGAVIGAVPALVGGLTALTGAAVAAAGALYAVGGLAVISVGLEGGEFNVKNFEPLIERLRQAFINSFGPIANDLEPLVVDAVGVLERLLPDVARAVRPAVRTITGELRELFSVVENTLPAFARRISQVAAAFVPFIVPLTRAVLTSGVFSQIGAFAADILPTLILLGKAVLNALPALLELSRGFLRVVTAVFVVIGAFLKFISIINNIVPLPVIRLLGVVIGLFLTLTTVVLLANVGMGSFVMSVLAAGKSLLLSYVPGVTAATASTWGLYAAAAAVVGILTFGLGPIIGTLAGGFGSLSGEIDTATKSLRQFGLEQRRLSDPSSFGQMGGVGGSATVDNRSYEVEVTNNVSGSESDGKRLRFENERTWDRIFTGG